MNAPRVLTPQKYRGLIESVKQGLRADYERRLEERKQNPLDWGKPLYPEQPYLSPETRYFTIDF